MSELVLNVTIKLGYANAKVYRLLSLVPLRQGGSPAVRGCEHHMKLFRFDLIKETQALGHQKSIAAFIKVLSPRLNVVPRLIVIRSFDVNKPSAEVSELKNGVAGSSILAGVLTFGMHVEICPDIATKDAQGHNRCHPIFSCTVTLLVKNNQVQLTVSGGLIGVGTMINPTLCRADRLIGQCAYALPSACTELECLLDIQTEDKKTAKVTKLVKNELLLINIGSTSTGGTTTKKERLEEYLAVADLPELTDAEIADIEEAGAKGPPSSFSDFVRKKTPFRVIAVTVAATLFYGVRWLFA
ncbi:translation protein [Phellopilus nigrolimitatus]|nr:translation protein [Phellopilus nigrolimitatus]